MMKGRFIKTGILVTAFLLIMGVGFAPRAQAACVIFDWENGVLDSGARTFTFDILVGDIIGLADLDGWQLDFDITRMGGPGDPFSFHYIDISGDSDYVFFGDSFDWGNDINDLGGGANYNFFGGDLTGSGGGVTPGSGGVGSLLARIVLDDVDFCNWFTITLNSGFSFFFDSGSGLQELGGTYDIHVVPIPGAVWLLGTGLLCLIGIRRRREG